MKEITYNEFKKQIKEQVDSVGYLTIITNIAWQLTITRNDIEKIKKSLESANAH